MPQDNIEIVRRIFESWGTGDFRAGSDDLDQHVAFVVSSDFPEFGSFMGDSRVSDFMTMFLSHWERITIEAADLRAVGDTIVTRVLQHATGKVSGIEGDSSYFVLFTFRGEKVVRIECVMHEADALEAVGLDR